MVRGPARHAYQRLQKVTAMAENMSEHLSHDVPYRTCDVCGWPIGPADLVTSGEFLARHRHCDEPPRWAAREWVLAA